MSNKNYILLSLLVFLLVIAKMIDEKEEQSSRSPLESFVLNSSFFTNGAYKIIKQKSNWYLNEKEVKKDFMQIYIEVLSQIEFVSDCDFQRQDNNNFLRSDVHELFLGEKLASDLGFILYMDDKCKIAKISHFPGLKYKNNQDKGEQLYQMIQNIFAFQKNNIELEP